MNALKVFYSLCIALSSILIIAVYLLFFDVMSESDMISLSFGWTFFFVIGLTGLLLKESPYRIILSIIAGGFALILLFIFFIVIFPLL